MSFHHYNVRRLPDKLFGGVPGRNTESGAWYMLLHDGVEHDNWPLGASEGLPQLHEGMTDAGHGRRKLRPASEMRVNTYGTE